MTMGKGMADMELMSHDNLLFDEISTLIEQSRRTMLAQMSSATVYLFWTIGKCINNDILKNERADYGKKIVSRVATQLSWSHFIELLPFKTHEAKMY